MQPYKAISCELVDHIEHFATLKQQVNINYFNDVTKQTETIKTQIITWQNKGNGEYILLANGLWLRMDKINKINNVIFDRNCINQHSKQ